MEEFVIDLGEANVSTYARPEAEEDPNASPDPDDAFLSDGVLQTQFTVDEILNDRRSRTSALSKRADPSVRAVLELALKAEAENAKSQPRPLRSTTVAKAWDALENAAEEQVERLMKTFEYDWSNDEKTMKRTWIDLATELLDVDASKEGPSMMDYPTACECRQRGHDIGHMMT